MFFKIHNEKIIGYKALTDADLGRRSSSHQTHIGLFDDVLRFLPNKKEVAETDSMLIYENTCNLLSVSFGRIENSDGSFRSPKIRIGERNAVSIVSAIRNITSQYDNSYVWFLFWFGLESEQVVFFLFNNKSSTFQDIKNLGIKLKPNVRNRLTEATPEFSKIINYLEKIVNNVNESAMKELEIFSQTGDSIKYRKYDLERANKFFAKIGRDGEERVARFLEKKKQQGEIINYTWLNEEEETFSPYDMTIQELDGNIIYLDVKSTNFEFEQKIVFSNQELDFISSLTSYQFHIYRVYNLSENNISLRICKNCKDHMMVLNEKVLGFSSALYDLSAELKTAKIALSPSIQKFSFGEEILL